MLPLTSATKYRLSRTSLCTVPERILPIKMLLKLHCSSKVLWIDCSNVSHIIHLHMNVTLLKLSEPIAFILLIKQNAAELMKRLPREKSQTSENYALWHPVRWAAGEIRPHFILETTKHSLAGMLGVPRTKKMEDQFYSMISFLFDQLL